MAKYQVTIGYKAVITVHVKADSEKEAKELAVEAFTKFRDKSFGKNNVVLEDDTFSADGVLNMDKTWNAL